jgi:hypothetical protein
MRCVGGRATTREIEQAARALFRWGAPWTNGRVLPSYTFRTSWMTLSEGIRMLANDLTQQGVPEKIFECYRAAEAGATRIGEGPFYTNAYRSLRRTLRLTRVTAAPDVVASRGDTSNDGLRGDGCRDRPLHAELKIFAENPALRARAPRQSCTGLIKAHGKQFFIAALEEVGSLGIVRCISHGCLFDAAKGAIQEAQNSSQGSLTRGSP